MITPSGSAAAAAAGRPAEDLQSLVNALGRQLQMNYRKQPAELQRRSIQLGQAIAAWNATPGTSDQRQQMVDWLRNAIHRSMPGSGQPMPGVPVFVSEQVAQSTAPAMPNYSAVPPARIPNDPFADDPQTLGAAMPTDVKQRPALKEVPMENLSPQEFWEREVAQQRDDAEFDRDVTRSLPDGMGF